MILSMCRRVIAMVNKERHLRIRVHALHAQKLSSSLISRQLMKEGFRVPSRTVRAWCQQLDSNADSFLSGRRYKRAGNSKANRQGKPPLSRHDKQRLASAIKGKPVRSAVHSLPPDLSASRSTLQRIAKSAGFVPKHPAKKPKLTRAQKRKRFTFAKTNVEFPWPTVVFIDEVDVPIHGGYNAHNDVQWLPKEETPKPNESTKFPITETRMAIITFEGGLDLVPCVSHPTAVEVQQLLEHVLPTIAAKVGHDYCLLHDNLPGATLGLMLGSC